MTTLRELLAQREAIDRQIEQARKQSRGEAIARVRVLMSEHGLTAADLEAPPAGSTEQIRVTRKVAAKYRNASTGESWSGRGLQPRWLRSALLNGKTIGEFAIGGTGPAEAASA